MLDLGRRPAARYINEEIELSEQEVTRLDLEAVAASIGSFDADNRAGMERTLHRISAIRNRRGEIVGLTCRVGRAVYGTIDIIKDLIESGQSILMMGAPGVGKTTMLREAARVLAASKRVIIVDTSNEIGGDGDVPHPAIGKARRMQVSHPERQHEVMIEAVENHNPEVIVIDEIGRELEASAARTIAERGVQLIGTAHGNALENLILNPTLSDLVGGIQAVTLGDDEARRRGTQKTVLERQPRPRPSCNVIPAFVLRLIERLPPRLRPQRSLLVYGPVQAGVYVAEYAAFLALVDGGRHVVLANTLSKLLALVLGYAAHAVWTFERRLDDDPHRRVARFLAVFAANTVLATLLLLALKTVLPVALAKPASDVLMGVFTYFALRQFVFGERPKT